MKHSRLVNTGFNWKKAQDRALEKQKQRSIQLATCNPDYQIEHPSECRANPEHKLLHQCHPEAEKRIIEKHLKTLRKAIVPSVQRPMRPNRLG